jgi:hypothetical protein
VSVFPKSPRDKRKTETIERDKMKIDLKFSIKISIALFGLGTVLLVLFAVNLSPTIALLGYAYTILAFAIGFLYVTVLIHTILKRKIKLREGLLSISVMLINIPISFGYVFVVSVLLNYARITIENTTGKEITSVKITGCENKELSKLGNGESQTLWINIPGDCQLNIEYEVNGQIRNEIIAGYLTNSGGIIATYKIGSNQDILL